MLQVALPVGIPGARQPWNRADPEVDDHDEFASDGSNGDRDLGGSGASGSDRSSRNGNGNGSNGAVAGKVAVRSAGDTLFPDRTLFIVIISLLSAVVLALLVGLIVLAFYCRRPERKPKTQVDGLPKEFDEALLEKQH